MSRVFIGIDLENRHLQRLRKSFPDIDIEASIDKERYPEYLKDAEAFITFFRCNKETLDMAPRLKWVQGLSAGMDTMPLDELKKRGVILTNGRGIHKIHMSEYAIAAMINLARNFHTMFRNQLDHKYERKVFQGEIYGSTVGILGLGSIGMEIAKRASFLGMRVIGVKSSAASLEYVDKVYAPGEMGEVFKQSDYVINLLPYTRETHMIINKDYFSLMKDTACFINMGRGKSVNEEDLIEALKNKKIRAMVTDVYYEEPLPENSPLWGLDNVILTPHICGESAKYLDRAMDIVEHNMRAFFYKEGSMINIVNLEKGY